jgi:cytochrome c556
MHRQVMARQHPEDFPPAYHDLTMAHHQAAEDLARTIPSRDLKKIMTGLDGLLKACVACHLEYRIIQRG